MDNAERGMSEADRHLLEAREVRRDVDTASLRLVPLAREKQDRLELNKGEQQLRPRWRRRADEATEQGERCVSAVGRGAQTGPAGCQSR